jgi:hypothetical protein
MEINHGRCYNRAVVNYNTRVNEMSDGAPTTGGGESEQGENVAIPIESPTHPSHLCCFFFLGGMLTKGEA